MYQQTFFVCFATPPVFYWCESWARWVWESRANTDCPTNLNHAPRTEKWPSNLDWMIIHGQFMVNRWSMFCSWILLHPPGGFPTRSTAIGICWRPASGTATSMQWPELWLVAPCTSVIQQMTLALQDQANCAVRVGELVFFLSNQNCIL